MAVNCEQDYFQYLKPGDKVHTTSYIEAISEEKTTALGTGFFVTQLTTFFNQHEEKVAEMRFRVLRYKPHPRPDQNAQEQDSQPAEKPAAQAGKKITYASRAKL